MKKISTIGFGTAAIGRPLYINIIQNADKKPFLLDEFKVNGFEILNEAFEQGIRFFDTSPGYGISEDLLIQWLAHKKDSTIKVSSKWGYTYVANFNPNAKKHEIKEHSLTKLKEQWEQTKKLLPYLKVYQIHSATLDTGVLENEGILNHLHQIKKEHHIIIGLSTTGINQVEVLKKALHIKIDNEHLFESFQCTFNILDQSLLRVKPILKNIKGPLIIKEAIANGRLIPNNELISYNNLYIYLKTLAKKYNTTPDAIVLNYCAAHFPNAIILSGASNKNHLASNLKSTAFSLTPLETEELDTFGISSTTYWNERKELKWN